MTTGATTLPTDGNPRTGCRAPLADGGFTLVEMLIALCVLTIGLLAAAQMIYVAASSASLARSKGNAAVAAQSKIEQLSALYSQNQTDANLTIGDHGPEQVQMLNPSTNTVLNRFNVSWTVSAVADPRPGRATLEALQVVVTATPIRADNSTNRMALLNKVVTVSAIFSKRY